MRWLAIDHGTKKIGLAFSDELEILASPFEVWPQEEARTLDRLARLCKEEGVQALAVGLPRHKDGAESATAPRPGPLARPWPPGLACPCVSRTSTSAAPRPSACCGNAA